MRKAAKVILIAIIVVAVIGVSSSVATLATPADITTDMNTYQFCYDLCMNNGGTATSCQASCG